MNPGANKNLLRGTLPGGLSCSSEKEAAGLLGRELPPEDRLCGLSGDVGSDWGGDRGRSNKPPKPEKQHTGVMIYIIRNILNIVRF